jgi:hypothetical protein
MIRRSVLVDQADPRDKRTRVAKRILAAERELGLLSLYFLGHGILYVVVTVCGVEVAEAGERSSDLTRKPPFGHLVGIVP